METASHSFKVIVVGPQSVGKTCIAGRLRSNTFLSDSESSIQCDVVPYKVELPPNTVNLQIWDTVGQEKFASIRSIFYRNCHAVVLVFDLTSAKSFEKLPYWFGEITKNVNDSIVLALVGNKLDDIQHREVNREMAERYAHSISALYHEVSAKTDIGVKLIFESVALRLLRKCSPLITNQSPIDERELPLVASATNLEANDVGTVEVVLHNRPNLAHGSSYSKCCKYW